MRRIAVFVDVQNIYYTCKQAYNKQFNYRFFWRYLSEMGGISIAKAYAIDKGDSQQQKFQSALRHIGFEVCLKPFIQRSDGTAKGDWDVGITIDVLEGAPQVDTIVLLSGDGDFSLLLEKVMDKYKCETIVMGVPQLTADAIKQTANQFIEINSNFLL
ncbi:NYN domain-containing protein [Catenovulum sediminis]|uniref:NYN domain-containing protein n=1 Tax=Catenovulum sediminis TaxID=1740262 RepID=A0ABV1RGI5_9ALTE|nr:NYN domain-containing protein [Catenovulum sediminis]